MLTIHLAPWAFGLIIIYVIALTEVFCHLLIGDIRRRRRRNRRPVVTDPSDPWYGRPYAPGAEPGAAETTTLPAEAVRLRVVAEADAAEAAFVSPGHARVEAFLAELFPRTNRAPKEES